MIWGCGRSRRGRRGSFRRRNYFRPGKPKGGRRPALAAAAPASPSGALRGRAEGASKAGGGRKEAGPSARFPLGEPLQIPGGPPGHTPTARQPDARRPVFRSTPSAFRSPLSGAGLPVFSLTHFREELLDLKQEGARVCRHLRVEKGNSTWVLLSQFRDPDFLLLVSGARSTADTSWERPDVVQGSDRKSRLFLPEGRR